MTEVNEGRKTRESMNFCIIFLSYSKVKEVNHSKQIQANRLKNDPSLGRWPNVNVQSILGFL